MLKMVKESVIYKDVDLTFDVYKGEVQGYNKYLETTHHISGGGGNMKTSSFSGKVSGTVSPISSSTQHKYISEFAIVENESSEISLNLINLQLNLRNGLRVKVWVEPKTKRVYKISNDITGEFSIVNSLGSLFRINNYYFKDFISKNSMHRYIWWATSLMIMLLMLWILYELFISAFSFITIIIGIIFAMMGFVVYKFVKEIMLLQLANGFKRQMKTKT